MDDEYHYLHVYIYASFEISRKQLSPKEICTHPSVGGGVERDQISDIKVPPFHPPPPPPSVLKCCEIL